VKENWEDRLSKIVGDYIVKSLIPLIFRLFKKAFFYGWRNRKYLTDRMPLERLPWMCKNIYHNHRAEQALMDSIKRNEWDEKIAQLAAEKNKLGKALKVAETALAEAKYDLDTRVVSPYSSPSSFPLPWVNPFANAVVGNGINLLGHPSMGMNNTYGASMGFNSNISNHSQINLDGSLTYFDMFGTRKQ
jgi:hypothetical protein